jgi:pyruvate dehydrogenase E2 component (dihydrolipoamide acetyltransferase)
MARFEFKLPDIGEGVTEGEIVAWYIKEGDRVAEDQVMVEVMTDKATVTIGAPRAGKIDALMAGIGNIVKVGDVLVVIQTGNGSRTSSGLPAATAVGDIKESLPGTGHFGEKRAELASQTQQRQAPRAHGDETVMARSGGSAGTQAMQSEDKPLATPATRKLARDLKVDLQSVPGSGRHGHVTRDDVLAHISAGALEAPAVGRDPGRGGRAQAQGTAGKRIPFVGLRRRIAEKMSTSKSTAAHFTFVEECEADRLIELRERLRPDAKALGQELTYLPFMIKAVVAALKKHPMLNSSLDVDKNELVLHDRYHIGIAAATEQGLVVPVIHDADQRNLLELASEVERLANAARDGTLTLHELSGSTFTITSLGKQSGLFAVPIINFPNVGILGVHKMKQRPVVRDGQIAIGHVMLLSLSLDHRIVDGHIGAAFAYDVIHYLEDPARLLLES